jgi:hypothetical protein
MLKTESRNWRSEDFQAGGGGVLLEGGDGLIIGVVQESETPYVVFYTRIVGDDVRSL